MKRPPLPSFEDTLRGVLELPTVAQDSAGATRVVRCLYMPSFHREVALTLVERGQASELTVRAPSIPVGPRWMEQVFGKPGHVPAGPAPKAVIERVTLPTEPLIERAVRALDPARIKPSIPTMTDGMKAELCLWQPDGELSYQLHSSEFHAEDGRYQVLLAMLQLSLQVLLPERFRVCLGDLQPYLRLQG